jgi:hypothetical protein
MLSFDHRDVRESTPRNQNRGRQLLQRLDTHHGLPFGMGWGLSQGYTGSNRRRSCPSVEFSGRAREERTRGHGPGGQPSAAGSGTFTHGGSQARARDRRLSWLGPQRCRSFVTPSSRCADVPPRPGPLPQGAREVRGRPSSAVSSKPSRLCSLPGHREIDGTYSSRFCSACS